MCRNLNIQRFERVCLLLLVLVIIQVANPAIVTIKSYKKDASGITFTLDKGLMLIKICKSDRI